MIKVSLKTFLPALLYFCYFLSSSQNYEIGCYSKISQTSGNLNQNLDSGDQFGYAVDDIGDLNNDGTNDLIVGAFTDDDGGLDRGAVYILFMSPDDSVLKSQKISSLEGGFTGKLNDRDVFGASVANLGDMNNDGLLEVAVGAEYDGDGGYWHGAVWILSLNPDGTVNQHSKISDQQGNFDGIFNGDVVFGTDVENMGDLNGDGVEDIIVAARRDNDGYIEAGALWILYLNNDFTVKSYKKISATEGGFTGNLGVGDYFGGAVAVLNDFDGDGIKEIAVGAYRDDDGGLDYGALYILFLNENGTVKKSQKISANTGGGIFNLNSNAIFAKSIDSYSDIDSDGLIEILVGCARCNNPVNGSQTGLFYLIELKKDGTVSEQFIYSYQMGGFEGILSNGDHFGMALSYLINTDPMKVAVGAPKDSEGAIWILNFNNELSPASIKSVAEECTINGIEISDLDPNSDYELSYAFNDSFENIAISSNDNGQYLLDNLYEGEYSNFVLRQNGCVYSFTESFQIAENITTETEFIVAQADCDNLEKGQIQIGNLPENTDFLISYLFNGSDNLDNPHTSNENGIIILDNLNAGVYSDFRILLNNCEQVYEIELELVNPNNVSPSFQFNTVSSCSVNNGSIEISNLEPSLNYAISYEFNEQIVDINAVSNNNGTIILDALESGFYFDFKIVTSSGCSYLYSEVIDLTDSESFNAVLSSQLCNAALGSVIIANLSAGNTYNLSYNYEGENFNLNYNADDAGEIEISNLPSGTYTNVVIYSELCEASLPNFEVDCELQQEELCYEYLNYFTPNSDGYHDNWRVKILNTNCKRNFQCYIFDRYGKLLKVLNGPSDYWDGTFNDKPMPPDDYWIRLEFPDVSDFKPEITHISLIR